MKRQKDMTPEDKYTRWEAVQYATGEDGREIINSSRKKELPGPKQKELSVVDVSGSEKPKMEKLYTVSKNKTRSWLWLKSWTPYCKIQT